jgi:1-deoxy-D-xylulose-5-phosphate synthase
MRLLDQINTVYDLRKLPISKLEDFCKELRQKTIETVSQTGGHLGAGLGVVELTTAIHYCFNTPEDKVIWDVGHQTYPHKIITGRKDKILTLRQANGLSGFTKITESIFDCFGAGHSSTSISAAIGMVEAQKILGGNNKVIAVIGDGAISAGMAYEALNNAAKAGGNLIIILNDNQMSISPAVGSMNNFLAKLRLSNNFNNVKKIIKTTLSLTPKILQKLANKTIKSTKSIIVGGNLFTDLGLEYIGPIDGHEINSLVNILSQIKARGLDQESNNQKPILLHVKTEKGKGFTSPKECEESYHAINKFNLKTNLPESLAPTEPLPYAEVSFSKIFGQELCSLAEEDPKIVAITAAMKSGTGLNDFAKKYPDRFFDVGIAEQHAVTFAAGLAIAGAVPFVAIYSTFLQRAYDQIIHDVAIQNLPVKFAIDRAGFVGADGPTHAGSFDITFLTTLPNFVLMAASSGQELRDMIFTAHQYNDGPIAIRYPRGNCLPPQQEAKLIPIGKAELINLGSDIAIISLGTRLEEAKKALSLLKKESINVTLVNARFAKPIDEEMIIKLSQTHKDLITLEEGSIGGFSSQIRNIIEINNLHKINIYSIFYPDQFLEQDSQENMHKISMLDANSIVDRVKNIIHMRERSPETQSI